MPRNTLTAEQIVRAAIGLLDDEGLDGLNMRALGERLGSAATAIYWHVKTKDELVRLAADAAWSEIPLPRLDAADWRTSATAMATGLHDMLTRHLWIGQAFGSYLLFGHGNARYDDHSLALWESAGFSPDEADQAAATVLLFVLGSALSPGAMVSLTRRLARAGKDAGKTIEDAMTEAGTIAESYPRLRERLTTTAGSDYAAAPDSTFTFGLRAILDGFQVRLGR
ncbi:TetR/AcrR family transcriptional regulator [Cryptosporangium sp. NPDC048952]|uniref:TetR/AcrR family transcriptional regulator n=1 Tax=Cryptosporangium sp. NPDC048952 TaxID=3363961 RepID=UPI00371DF55F